MTFPAALDDYLTHLEDRNYSPNTLDRLRIVLTGFARFCDPMAADGETVERWLGTRKIGATTRYTYLQYLGGFYRWAVRRGRLAADPTALLDRPKVYKGLPRPVRDDALSVALAAADPRMRLMLCLGAYQGMRCQEIAGLAAEDLLPFDPPMLIIANGKGRRQRTTTLAEDTEAALAAYGPPASGPVFARRGCGCALCPQTVSIYISRHFHDLRLPYTAHQLRHWYGTNLYRATLDIRACQTALGHASVATTQIYTAFAPPATVAAMRTMRVHPAA